MPFAASPGYSSATCGARQNDEPKSTSGPVSTTSDMPTPVSSTKSQMPSVRSASSTTIVPQSVARPCKCPLLGSRPSHFAVAHVRPPRSSPYSFAPPSVSTIFGTSDTRTRVSTGRQPTTGTYRTISRGSPAPLTRRATKPLLPQFRRSRSASRNSCSARTNKMTARHHASASFNSKGSPDVKTIPSSSIPGKASLSWAVQ